MPKALSTKATSQAVHIQACILKRMNPIMPIILSAMRIYIIGKSFTLISEQTRDRKQLSGLLFMTVRLFSTHMKFYYPQLFICTLQMNHRPTRTSSNDDDFYGGTKRQVEVIYLHTLAS